jgi:hypothetical protein
MVMIALYSSLVGAVLGTQWKVKVLFPAAGVGAAIIAVVAVWMDSPLVTTMSALGIWVFCLQFGYLMGLLTRYCLEAAGLAPQRSAHSSIARH